MNYNEVRETIDKIVKAVKEGNYSVSYEAPNNIGSCTAPDGRTFYKVYSMDDARSSTCFGSCSVDVEGCSFLCNLENGEVESEFFDNIEDEYELEDGSHVEKEELVGEIVDAFENTDDIVVGEYTDVDAQMSFYALVNDIDDPEYYWCEDDDCPIDKDDDWEGFTEPENLGYGTVTYNGEEYYLVDEIYDEEDEEDEENEQLHAVHCEETPDDYGCYSTVLLELSYEEGGEVKVISCKECDDVYNAVEGYVE